ncbi:MAG: sn-glycerol-3-phosphate ABC transporter ATP-binding protein UgpC [Hyphomicrobiaceae bacterium]|nr:sn-glycerol-3-phosphate ABC transporter ATP-binding protein UgpC [Hyphomicrobiaceae bacterium]
MASVTLENVKKVYAGGVEAVQGVSLAIPDGEFTVLLGPSGCGKSTLLRMIAGLETITEGTISIGGRIVNHIEPAERDVAMVFQNYALYPHMSVYDNMAYGLRNRGAPKREIEHRVMEAAKLLAIVEFLKRKPRELSGGQRQRVAMGRAIVREPQAFLFDEPLSNLDAKLRLQMRIEIRRLHNRLKATSIFVTHDQIEAMTMADTIVVMNQGHVEQVGAPAEVYRLPATRFVATFIGSPPMNLLPGRIAGADEVEVGRERIAFDSAAFPVEPGRAVEVGVRPEDLRLETDGTGTLTFTGDFTEELGATRLLHGVVGDWAMVVALHGPAPRGDSFRLRADPAAVHLFDPATGYSLRRTGQSSA